MKYFLFEINQNIALSTSWLYVRKKEKREWREGEGRRTFTLWLSWVHWAQSALSIRLHPCWVQEAVQTKTYQLIRCLSDDKWVSQKGQEQRENIFFQLECYHFCFLFSICQVGKFILVVYFTHWSQLNIHWRRNPIYNDDLKHLNSPPPPS